MRFGQSAPAYTPITADSVSERLGVDVPDLYVLIAKNSVMELDAKDIAQILGVEQAEVEEVMDSDLYKSVRLIIGAEANKNRIDVEEGWDALERISLKGLLDRAHQFTDPELLLRTATAANRAMRRTAPRNGVNVIDPNQAGAVVRLSLTTRMIEKMGEHRQREISQTKELSLMDGSAVNPNLHELNQLFGESSPIPSVEQRLSPPTRNDDFSEAEMRRLMQETIDGRKGK